MNRLSLLFLLPVLLLFFTCKKEQENSGPTQVKGRVLDEVTQEPIWSAEVFLLRRPSGGFWYAQQQFAVTGQDGRFQLDFEADKEYTYAIAARRARYHDSEYLDVERGRKQNKDITLTPEGFVRLVFVNKPPLDTVDWIGVSFSFGGPAYNVYDTAVFNYKGFGGRDNSVAYFIQRNGVQQNYPGTYFCPRHDTATYYIDY